MTIINEKAKENISRVTMTYSLGLARALTENSQEAIDDLQAFVIYLVI